MQSHSLIGKTGTAHLQRIAVGVAVVGQQAGEGNVERHLPDRAEPIVDGHRRLVGDQLVECRSQIGQRSDVLGVWDLRRTGVDQQLADRRRALEALAVGQGGTLHAAANARPPRARPVQ